MVSVSLHPRAQWCTRELLAVCLPLTRPLPPSVHSYLSLTRAVVHAVSLPQSSPRCIRLYRGVLVGFQGVRRLAGAH